MHPLRAISRNRGQKWLLALPLVIFFVLALPISTAFSRPALVSFPPRPPEGTFVVDSADMISPADEAAINREAAALLEDEQVPIIVVTIRSLSSQDASDYSIERYAAALFDAYGIGSPERNYGILLLVSRGDRQARIELGADWGRRQDDAAQRIMDRRIIPEFRDGDFSQGTLAGVQSLADMARGEELPAIDVSYTQVILLVGFFLFGLAIAISLFRNGRSGWGWAVLAFLGVALVFIFGILSIFGSGSSAGSSFGGGFSGGGGATGSW